MIRPIEMNAVISRTQDVNTIKQNEDSKPMIDQRNFQAQFNKEVEQHTKTVHNADDTQKKEEHYDAKEKGGGQYSGDGGKKKKKQKENEEGKVLIKGYHKFDMKI